MGRPHQRGHYFLLISIIRTSKRSNKLRYAVSPSITICKILILIFSTGEIVCEYRELCNAVIYLHLVICDHIQF